MACLMQARASLRQVIFHGWMTGLETMNSRGVFSGHFAVAGVD